MDNEEKLKLKRSQVRVYVTYIATGFVFFGSATLILWLMYCKMFVQAKDLFLGVLPVATGIITYWFADRSRSKNPNDQ